MKSTALTSKDAWSPRPSVLPVMRVMIDNYTEAKEVSASYPFSRAIEMTAIEFLDGNARPQNGMKLTPEVLTFDIDLSATSNNPWKVYIDLCAEGDYTQNLVWPTDKDGRQAVAYAALVRHIETLLQDLRKDDRFKPDIFLIFTVQLKGVSSHTRLKLAQTREHIIQDYTGSRQP